jgi:hypothetical protein
LFTAKVSSRRDRISYEALTKANLSMPQSRFLRDLVQL